MPIEVREIIIKAQVQSDKPGAGGQSGSKDAGKGNNSVTEKEEIIQACIDRILEILRTRFDR